MKQKKNTKKDQYTIASKKIKFLGVNLTKDENDLYKETIKLLKKEIEEDYIESGEISHAHGLVEST
jgi:hypothetical protein